MKQAGCAFRYKKLLQAPFITVIKAQAGPDPAEIWLHGLHPFSPQRAAGVMGVSAATLPLPGTHAATEHAAQPARACGEAGPHPGQPPKPWGNTTCGCSLGGAEYPRLGMTGDLQDKQLAKAFAVNAGF